MEDILSPAETPVSYDGARFQTAVGRAYQAFLQRTSYGQQVQSEHLKAIEQNRKEMTSLFESIPDRREGGNLPASDARMIFGGEGGGEGEDYVTRGGEAPDVEFGEDGWAPVNVKLANYGYDSDSSSDYNSNVLKIGHANNKLEDGVSAAVSKALATKLGLKDGDWFDVQTTKGQMRVRYDDTVPPTYKGKPLPPTIDIYRRDGSNSWGGKVTGIRLLGKQP